MELLPAGIPLGFEVTYDSPSLFVGMSVYDDSGPTPVLLLSPFAMTHVGNNTYRGKFTPDNGKIYVVIKAVYTDGTYTTVDDNYSQGSESCVAQYLNANQGGDDCEVVGIVDQNIIVIGVVNC